jgi:hypothetical protein
VHSLLGQPERATPPPRPEMMLAAYHAHLAGHVRYYGPLARSICASDLLPALRTEQRI